jgi:HSP20 family protein
MPLDAHRAGDEVVVEFDLPGVFSRRLLLGDILDTERVQAIHDEGAPTLRIPVLEKAKPRRIAITSTGQDLKQADA